MFYSPLRGFPGGSGVSKESAWTQEMQVQFLGREDPLEEEIVMHSNILTWRMLWTEEPGKLWGEAGGGAGQSQGIQEERERSKKGEFDFRHVGGT